MKIKIDEIPAQGLHKELKYNAEALDLEIEKTVHSLPIKFGGPVLIQADINILEGELVIKVKLNYKLRLVCSRCLEEFEAPFEKFFVLNYNIRDLEEVDIRDNIREEVILDYPLKPLCKADCRGICPGCGVNLNIEECKCGVKNSKW